MVESVAYNGKVVEVCGSPRPRQFPKRFPTARAERFLILFRGVNIHGELIDEYYVAQTADSRHWLLLAGGYDQNDEETFCHACLGWCSCREVDRLEAASALLAAHLRSPSGSIPGPVSILWTGLFPGEEVTRVLESCGLVVEPFDFSVDHPMYCWLE